MDPKAMRNLHLDVRLQKRKGWISPEELETVLSDLPDTANKIQQSSEENVEAAPPAAAPAMASDPLEEL